MTDIVERYFLALGWLRVKRHEFYAGVRLGDAPCEYLWVEKYEEVRKPDPKYYADLPNILESFPAFKEFVLERMEGGGYSYYIADVMSEASGYEWGKELSWQNKGHSEYNELIIDNEILKAAVIAATRYWEEKK